ncbi:FKBP-type peptidyl-prolyl cis-trans isomerase [Alteromonas australica]|jgi:FKBP-type peptidyl-prolyl cis-trans isomerase FkpA|uniref:Peptidyl-prolyl cis-trans isomerase n=1 Tax=Alteromonas australica TaxID=589873 RepID=A0A075P6K0_9ALTE|nr:FKBP-type peptidyl-prolyl cis-trans isomerase [Alteromonas australica]AIG00551.1 peptidylprolyl isomerase [Alteromonas australica]MAF69055.1 peptidylprolyl isomerase [Alteromonas sp.]|tara:strand:+ start:844 stop:1629 length:786 start_codon:yes stop_codon:yes gene_type:complete
MQKSLVALSTLAALGLFACQPNTSDEATTTTTETTQAPSGSGESMTDAQKQAYAMGASMGLFVNNRAQQQEQLGLPLDQAALKEGFNDGLNDSLKFTQQEIQEIAQQGEQVLRAKQQEMAEAAAAKNIEAGEAYLAENAKRDGVIVTESGLQYEVLEEGEGESPSAEDEVKVHYRGTLLDGTEFDSSYARNEPAQFPLNRVIPGWTEGVQLMKEGAKYRFHIPSELAYGERATGSITPNSTLIFDVELLEVIPVNAEGAAE